MGYAVALGLGLTALYLTESSPKECRGLVSMMQSLIIICSTIIGAVVGIPQIFGNDSNWWLIYLIEVIMLIVEIFLFSMIAYESPGFLILRGLDERARPAIQAYFAPKPDEIDMIISELKENLNTSSKASIGMIEIWKDPIYRRLMIPGLVLALAVTFSGIAGNYFFKE
uniref:Major facilitator superfamily (MFS) profile domain-containing protein n=1 Tax=Acrobeloides nanus TaxID=290746 RepID=A0A914CT87_9BILA